MRPSRDNSLLARWALVSAVAAAMLLTGCAETALSRWNRYNPFRHDDWEAERKFGRRPADHLVELQTLASQAPSLSVSQQQQHARQIAAEFPNEVDPMIRRAMVLAIAGMPQEEASETLRAAMKDADPKVRSAACEAWGQRPADEAIHPLVEAIGSDADVDVRLTAVRALGNFPHNPDAIRGLGLALDDNDPALQYRAVQSLKAITTRDYGGNLHAWREFTRGGDPQVTAERDPWATRWLPSLGWW